MGGNGGQSFYRRDELSTGKRSDPKSVRFFRSVFFRGELLLYSGTCTSALFFFRLVSLVTLVDKVTSYVSRYRSYPPPS